MERNIKKTSGFVRIFNYNLKVDIKEDIDIRLIKNDFTADEKERKKWFILSVIGIGIPVLLALILFFALLVSAIRAESSSILAIAFYISIILFMTLFYIFFIRVRYANYSNKGYKR